MPYGNVGIGTAVIVNNYNEPIAYQTYTTSGGNFYVNTSGTFSAGGSEGETTPLMILPTDKLFLGHVIESNQVINPEATEEEPVKKFTRYDIALGQKC